MSTEFVSNTTGELGFVRWFGGHNGNTSGSDGLRYEFGTITNWIDVVGWVRSGDRFVPITGERYDTDPQTVEDFEELVRSDRASFGDFGVTVALGSGEATRFTVEE